MKQAIFGIVLFLVGLWGGAYAWDALNGTWAHFPAVMTAVCVCVAGIPVFVYGYWGDR